MNIFDIPLLISIQTLLYELLHLEAPQDSAKDSREAQGSLIFHSYQRPHQRDLGNLIISKDTQGYPRDHQRDLGNLIISKDTQGYPRDHQRDLGNLIISKDTYSNLECQSCFGKVEIT